MQYPPTPMPKGRAVYLWFAWWYLVPALSVLALVLSLVGRLSS